MIISSDDIAPIITAACIGVATVGGMVTNLILTLRQGRVQRQHGADIAELKTAATGTHPILPDK